MILKLKDGTKITTTDSSDYKEIVIVLKNKTDFTKLQKQITAENLNGAQLGKETLQNMIVAGSQMYEGDDNFLTAHFSLSQKTPAEIEREQSLARITDLEDMIADIAGGAE